MLCWNDADGHVNQHEHLDKATCLSDVQVKHAPLGADMLSTAVSLNSSDVSRKQIYLSKVTVKL